VRISLSGWRIFGGQGREPGKLIEPGDHAEGCVGKEAKKGELSTRYRKDFAQSNLQTICREKSGGYSKSIEIPRFSRFTVSFVASGHFWRRRLPFEPDYRYSRVPAGEGGEVFHFGSKMYPGGCGLLVYVRTV